MTQKEKKEDELKHARFFLKEFDSKNRCDYTAVPNNDEPIYDPEVDVYARSSVCKELKLQIKIIDKGYMPRVVQCKNETLQSPDGCSEIYVRNLDVVEWAKQTIVECLRKYEGKVRKTLVLLLCVYHGGELNQEYAKKEFADYHESDFGGIYLIDPPYAFQSDFGIEKYYGQLTAIKPIFMNFSRKFGVGERGRRGRGVQGRNSALSGRLGFVRVLLVVGSYFFQN